MERFRNTGRQLLAALAHELFERVATLAAEPAQREQVWEAEAHLYFREGRYPEAGECLKRCQDLERPGRASLMASIFAEMGETREAATYAARLAALRIPPFRLKKLRGAEWEQYLEHLLNSKEEPSPAVLERPAQRAIERGHFDRAADLIRRGLSVDRHNLYLHASNAKLLHEQG